MIMDERDTRMRTFLTIGLIGLTGAFGYSMGVDRTGRIQDERLGKDVAHPHPRIE